MVTPDSADQPIESIEMTQNEVYGIPLTKGTGKEAAADITTEKNVVHAWSHQWQEKFPMETSHWDESHLDL